MAGIRSTMLWHLLLQPSVMVVVVGLDVNQACYPRLTVLLFHFPSSTLCICTAVETQTQLDYGHCKHIFFFFFFPPMLFVYAA